VVEVGFVYIFDNFIGDICFVMVVKFVYMLELLFFKYFKVVIGMIFSNMVKKLWIVYVRRFFDIMEYLVVMIVMLSGYCNMVNFNW